MPLAEGDNLPGGKQVIGLTYLIKEGFAAGACVSYLPDTMRQYALESSVGRGVTVGVESCHGLKV